MPVLLESLLTELNQKCLIIGDILTALECSPPLDGYALRVYHQVENTRREVNRLLHDPALGNEHLLSVQYQDYQRLVRQVLAVESYSLPVVLRFNPDDAYMTALCDLLMQQSQVSLPPPIVATFSTEYYWILGQFNLICTSALECHSLLGLPDLYHEVAHLLIIKNLSAFVADFLAELRQYVEQEKRRAVMEQRGRDPDDYDTLYVQWEEYWVIEFTADMVATYLVGEAYGWQHLRLCSRMGEALYSPSLGEEASHPADEARLRGIVTMLGQIGYPEAAEEIQFSWETYVQHLGDTPTSPGDYQSCYPEALMTLLARHVQRACETLGLRKATGASPDDETIILSHLINTAWKLFMQDASGYTLWEKSQVDQLRAILVP